MDQQHLYLQLGLVVLVECVKTMVATTVSAVDQVDRAALVVHHLLALLIKLEILEHLCILL